MRKLVAECVYREDERILPSTHVIRRRRVRTVVITKKEFFTFECVNPFLSPKTFNDIVYMPRKISRIVRGDVREFALRICGTRKMRDGHTFNVFYTHVRIGKRPINRERRIPPEEFIAIQSFF